MHVFIKKTSPTMIRFALLDVAIDMPNSLMTVYSSILLGKTSMSSASSDNLFDNTKIDSFITGVSLRRYHRIILDVSVSALWMNNLKSNQFSFTPDLWVSGHYIKDITNEIGTAICYYPFTYDIRCRAIQFRLIDDFENSGRIMRM